MNTIRGHIQVSVLATIITSGTFFCATIVASYLTASAATDSKIADIKLDASIVNQRENDHYAELNKDLNRIEGKLDTIIKQ